MTNQVKEAQFRLSVVLLLFGGFILLSSKLIQWETWFNVTFFLGIICLIMGLIIGIISSMPTKQIEYREIGGPGGI